MTTTYFQFKHTVCQYDIILLCKTKTQKKEFLLGSTSSSVAIVVLRIPGEGEDSATFGNILGHFLKVMISFKKTHTKL